MKLNLKKALMASCSFQKQSSEPETSSFDITARATVCWLSGACGLTRVATLGCSDVVVQQLSIVNLLHGVSGRKSGHPGNVGQTAWRSLGHRRAATLQQELSVIDDPGT